MPDDVLAAILQSVIETSLASARSLTLVSMASHKLVAPMLSVLRPVDQSALKASQAYFLVSRRWWTAWASDACPGPVDNSDVVDEGMAKSPKECSPAVAQLRASVQSSHVVALEKIGFELVDVVHDMLTNLALGRGPKASEVDTYDEFFKQVVKRVKSARR